MQFELNYFQFLKKKKSTSTQYLRKFVQCICMAGKEQN